MITESIRDYTHADQGQVHGQIIYTYNSPTHWGSEGVCENVLSTRVLEKSPMPV